jgi:TRAP-type mannitol/chloroaromatic compound transport system permease small subunit
LPDRQVDAFLLALHRGQAASKNVPDQGMGGGAGRFFLSSLLALSRAIDAVNGFIGRNASWAILLAVLVSNAWLELQWYLFGAAFLLAAAYTLRENEHIRVDVIYGRFSRRTQHWIDLFGHVVFLMPFALLMIYYLGPYALRSFRSGEVSTNSGGLVIWPAKALLFAGFLLLAFQGVSEIIKKVAVMRGLIPDPTPYVPTHPPIATASPIAATDEPEARP